MLTRDFLNTLADLIAGRWPDARVQVNPHGHLEGDHIITTVDGRHFALIVAEVPSRGACGHE